VGRWGDRATGSSSVFLFAGTPAQAVALELNAMSISDQAATPSRLRDALALPINLPLLKS
jgi:hypothetical protein